MNIESLEFIAGEVIYEIENGVIMRNSASTGVNYLGSVSPANFQIITETHKKRCINRYLEVLFSEDFDTNYLEKELKEGYRIVGVINEPKPFVTTDELFNPYKYWISPQIEKIDRF